MYFHTNFQINFSIWSFREGYVRFKPPCNMTKKKITMLFWPLPSVHEHEYCQSSRQIELHHFLMY